MTCSMYVFLTHETLFSELPAWLNKLSQKPSIWDGVLLSSSVADQYKDVIKSDKATLLELRNYLFLRQCKLLTKLKRRWEIPSRLQEFLFTVIHELKLLNVSPFKAFEKL